MALVVKDRVKQTTTTTGTGTLTLNGTVDGFQTFAAALSDGDTTYYALLEPSTNSWEVGLGTWTESTTTLARTTILESSNSGSAINLTAGEAEVFITQPAEKAVYYDANGDITPTGNVDVAGTLDVTGAATFDDSVTIQGNLTINGTTTTVSATNLAIEDNMIYLNDGSTTTNPDLGWAGNYNDGTYAHAGVFRDASDSTFKIYDGYTPEPGAAIDTTHASFTLAPLNTGALSVEGNVTVTGTVDGRDVASDGSKLDGIEAGATGDQSASEILTAVKTVDGSGSGLDADLLDGQQGSYYLDWTHVTNKPDPSVTLSGDVSGSATMTNLGSINITTTVANDSHTHDGRYYTESEIGNFFLGTTAITGYNKSNWDTAFGWGNHASAGYLAASSYTAADVLAKIKTVDGAGSGLDADTLDGTSLFGAQQFIQATALTSSDNLDTIISNGHYRWSGSAPVNAPSGTYHNMIVLNDGGQATQMVWGGVGSGTADIHIRRRDSGTWQPWTTFWNSGNDGAGSGLDADLLDGQHGSYYYSPANAPDPTLTLSGDVSGSATFTNLGNATLSVTVADDSHNHVISNVDGLQTALDGKLSTSGKAADSNLLDGIDSGNFLRSDIDDTLNGDITHTGVVRNTNNANVDGPNFNVSTTNKDTTEYAYRVDRSGTTVGGIRIDGRGIFASGSTVGGNNIWHSGNDGSGSGLDADLLDGVQGSSYLRSDVSDTMSGNLTLTGTVDHTGLYNGIYHGIVEDRYYSDDYNGARNLSAFLETQRSDIIRYRPVSNLEYWDGSAWQDGSSQLSNLKRLLDGRKDTVWQVPSTYYKFRFTVTANTSWPLRALIGLETSWTGSTYQGCQMLVEELQTDSSWDTKVTADFTSSNGVTNWGTMLRADSALHTGRGSQVYATRITIDFSSWVPSNPSYVTVPLQNIFVLSNHAGAENNDYKSLLDYDQNINAPANITVTGTVDGRDVAADGAKLDGIESGATADQTPAELLASIKTVDGSGSGLDADTVDGLQASQFIRSDATDTATGVITFSDRIQAHEIRTNTNQELILSAGESASYATGQTGEYVYVNAEQGLQINTSPDNWSSGWAGRDTFTFSSSGMQFPDGTTQTTAAPAAEQDYGLITGSVTVTNDYGALA